MRFLGISVGTIVGVGVREGSGVEVGRMGEVGVDVHADRTAISTSKDR